MTASFRSGHPLTPSGNSPVSFSGRGREFLKMLITGSLLQIPTFGFYRFWLITKLRRHLWANTQVEGEAFEYTGTAKELLIGFLMALAVLVPLYIAYFIASITLEAAAPFASIPLILIMYVLVHFGSYRARKYRASRTVFRGIRFWMKGSGWAYALRAILWDFATILSLGLALPWAMANLERYRMRHTFFGSMQGDFSGSGWSLFKGSWWVWALGVAIVIGILLIAAGAAFSLFTVSPLAKGSTGHWPATGVRAVHWMLPFLILLTLALWPLATAIFIRWHIDGLRFGEVTASSRVGKGAIYGLFLKLILSSIGFMIAVGTLAFVTLTLFGPVFQGAFNALRAGGVTASVIGAVVLVALFYLMVLLGLGVIQRYFFGRGLWAAVAASISVSNLRSLDTVVAAGQPSGVLGEGLADALDFNAGI